MKLILSQYRPAIRLYKWAVTLQKQGHKIKILKTRDCVENIDFSRFEVENYKPLTKYEADYHISFNTNTILSNIDLPTIQAVGDLKFNEREYNSLLKAVKCVFVSEVQMETAIKCYPFVKDKSKVIYNGIIDEMKQDTDLPKLGGRKINLVYSGTITDIKENHRYLLPIFEKISNMKEVQLHVYPSALGLAECYNIPNIIIHDTVSPMKLIKELTQYDVGLIYWENNNEVADMSLPNKLFEYLQAGLPIVAGEYKQLMMFNENKDCVGFFNNDNIENTIINMYLKYKVRSVKRHTVTYNTIEL